MLQALLLSAVLMGLAGTPHCLAMCGAACRVAAGPQVGWFHGGRLLSYAAAGAVAAASVSSLAATGTAVAVLRPIWTLVHVAALALGLWLLWRGRQPAWMAALGHARPAPVTAVPPGAWRVLAGPVRGAAAGLGWVAMPCGLLQSALLVAALANTAAQGALVMAGFAAASGLGLALGPALWWRLAALTGRPGGALIGPAFSSRLAGFALAMASAWALGHGLWLRVAAWCVA